MATTIMTKKLLWFGLYYYYYSLTFVDAFSRLPVSLPSSTTRLFFSATTKVGTAPTLKSLLKKPSKVLTVGVEYVPTSEDSDLDVFSMKLRQQAKVSFVVCSDLQSIKGLADEQETARGNFPGPIPIIYQSDNNALDQATLLEVAKAGASAIVVDGEDQAAKELVEFAGQECQLEIIWKVGSEDSVKSVLEWTEADIFWTNTKSSLPLPSSCMGIGVIDEPMQPDGAEIETGKEYKSMGCSSVLVRNACVGDKEDIDYASFLVGGLTSKASSEFKFSGLTGSTNGHFGGIQSNSSVRWERVERNPPNE